MEVLYSFYYSAMAAFIAIRCRCGIVFSPHPLYRLSERHSLFHNGSKTCDPLPLWHRLFCRTLSTGSLCRIVPPSLFHNGSKTRDSLPLRHRLFYRTLFTGSRAALCLRPSSTTAAKPAILCRCGTAFSAAPSSQALCAALCLRPSSTTAAKPAILCHCGETGTFLLSLLAEILNE